MILEVLIQCRLCKKKHILMVDFDSYNDWRSGRKKIQEALPELKPEERELLISHTCAKCWDAMWKGKNNDLLRYNSYH